jgi:hypothetical protein
MLAIAGAVAMDNMAASDYPLLGVLPMSQLGARSKPWSMQSKLWALLIVTLVLTALYVAVLIVCEQWTLMQSIFYAVSMGMTVGMVPEDADGNSLNISDDVAIMCTCFYAIACMLCIAGVGALLAETVLLRDERFMQRELKRVARETLAATTRVTAPDGSQAPTTRATAHDEGARATFGSCASHGPRQRARGGGVSRIRRMVGRFTAMEAEEDRITGHWHVAVVISWLVTLACGFIYGYYGNIPGADDQDASRAVFAFYFAISAITSLGMVSPLDSGAGLAFTTVYILVGVPLNAAMLSVFVDRYLSREQVPRAAAQRC